MISPCDIVFDDSMKTAAVTVDGGLARPNIDYTLSGETAATEVGTYTITITAEKNGNYIGSAEKVWSIVKAKPAESPEGGYVCESEDGTAFIGGESMSKIVKDANNSGDTTLSIISDEITVAFDSDAIVSLGTDPITLTQTKLDKEKAGAAWEIFGDNPVIYDISLGEPRDFGSGLVKITIPYTLGEGEKPEGLKILYVVDGVVQEEIPCTYSDGKVTFQTSHLSVYGVKYTEPEGDGGSSGLPVTGIVIGAVAALALIGAAVLLIKRRSA